jgi:hypothetical protein
MRISALERPDAPLASAFFSSSTTRLTPAEASASAMLVPITPPPITTTSAVSGMAESAFYRASVGANGAPSLAIRWRDPCRLLLESRSDSASRILKGGR